MVQSLQVIVDSTCIISGYCRRSAPEVFVAGAEGKTVVKSCPVEAISATDAATGAQVFP